MSPNFVSSFRWCATMPRALFDHAGDAAGVEVAQLLFLAHGGDEARVLLGGLRRALHVHGEIDLHLEQLAKIRIVVEEQVIDIGSPMSTTLIFSGIGSGSSVRVTKRP